MEAPGRQGLVALEDGSLAGALVLLDHGAAELVRWSGGLSYIIDELGAALAVDIQDELKVKPGMYKKACVLLTTFVWEFEHAISKLAGLCDELTIYSSLSSDAHANHAQARDILGDLNRDVFSILASQFAAIPRMTPSIRVGYLPLHIYNIIGPGSKSSSLGGMEPLHQRHADIFQGEACQSVLDMTGEGPAVFVTCNPDCCKTYPLQLSDFVDCATPITDISQIVAEDIPMRLRIRYRTLSYALAGALKHQLRVDVREHIFPLGKTASLLGTSLGRVLDSDSTTTPTTTAPGTAYSSPGGLGLSGSANLQPASIVLIDRTLDVSTALSHDLESLLQKVVTVLPRSGPRPSKDNIVDETASLNDVGVNPPHLMPVLDKFNPTPAFPALAAFPWQAPPSLCHPCGSVAAILVKAMASIKEAEAHVVLRRALNSLIEKFGCPPPPPKRRGPGAEIMALINSLSSQGMSICHKCRAVLQIALAVVETLQRTKDSTWDEMAASQKVIRQSLLERPDDVTLTSLLLKCLESKALSLQDCLSLCLFGKALHGDTVAAPLRQTLRDALAHRIKDLIRAAKTEEDLVALRLLPYDLVKALSEGGGVSEDALNMELADVVEEDFLLRFEEIAQARRRLQTSSLRELMQEDPRSECSTLVGRLTNILLTGDDNELEQLSQDLPKVGNTLQQLSRVGFGILASGIGKLGGVLRGTASSPAGRPLIIIFVIGGLTYQEVREVTMVTKASKLVRSLGSSGGDDPRTKTTVLLGSTSITTPGAVLHRTISRSSSGGTGGFV